MKKGVKIFLWIVGIIVVILLVLMRLGPTDPEPDAFEESVIEFCAGASELIKGAKAYDPQADYHPVMWIDTHYMSSTQSDDQKEITSDRTDSLFPYDEEDTVWERPATVFDYELVVCSSVSDVGRDEYCSYTGGISLRAYDTTKEFKVYRMDTGELLGEFNLASRSGCPAVTASNDSRNVYNNVTYESLREKLARYVSTSAP